MKGLISWSMALVATSTLAACSNISQIGQSSSAVPTFETTEGVAITPTQVEQDPVAEILGIQMWTFDVVLPDSVSLDPDGTLVAYQLELRQPGQTSEVLTSFSATSSDQNFELLVGLHPLGNTLAQAETLQYYLRAGGTSSFEAIANPFKQLSSTGSVAWSKRQPTEMEATDNEIVLMEIGSAGRFPDPQNSLVVLTIKVEESN